ncbi:zinc-binding alcohol dehydrogenase family protein [Paenibacillus nasutitermitis]|uniref:Alcohol dehydrogenase n=1 Tax=Paenibacillus nasutitermitis TaxID=1652958 RepID=A0A916YP49_9BACL|nr:zinc-binding alcohol dehydrogenase family protein [Paenibacillus nasutitermitis]GGD52583.1 alcohol dehydrogenase [Paenibacillus nasutitermitis]
MKTIICEHPDKLYMTETEAPSFVPGEALVRIRRVGICGTDMHAYKGNQPFFEYPRILGHELSGIVERVEDDASGIRAGDQVAIIPYMACGACIACRAGKTNCCTSMQVLGVHRDGGMREVISVPTSLLIRTEGLTLDQSAVVEPLAIGAHAVRRSELKRGEFVLVIGAGPIGLGVMAFAKERGAKVIAMDIHDERLSFCRSWAGAEFTINARDNPLEKLDGITGGDYPTVVFDATGNVQSMGDAFGYVAHGGKLIFVGLVRADITFNDPEFHKRELTLMGSRNATPEDFDTVLEALRCGAVGVERYITHRAPFDGMLEQFQHWLKPESKVIKAMVEL